jgi:hypothetical protein
MFRPEYESFRFAPMKAEELRVLLEALVVGNARYGRSSTFYLRGG